jgi:hypothetical protein
MARPHPARGWFLATLTSVAGIAGVSWWIGPSRIVAPWDVFTLLNGAYRIYEGQAPSTDFANPIGPLVYGMAAIGMHLQHSPSLAAVTYGNLIFLAIVSALAWSVAWRRLPALYAAAFTVFVAVLVVDLRPLGYSPWTLSYAMLYNRYGWLLYSTLLLLVLLGRREPPAKRTHVIDGLLLGLLLGLLFYDKITFFLAALAAVGLGLALSTLPRDWRLGVSAIAGFAAIGILVRVLFNLSTSAYIGDLIDASRVQAAGQRAGILAHSIAWNLPVAAVALAVVGGLLLMAHRHGESMRPLVYLTLAASFVLGSSIIITTGNATEKSDLPALVVIPLLIVAFLAPRLPVWAGGVRTPQAAAYPGRLPGRLLAGLAVLLVITTGPIVGKEALGLGKAISLRGYDAPATQLFNAGRLHDFVIPADAQWPTAYRIAHNLPAMINDGLSLLRENIRPGDSVFTLAYTDPFYVALGLPLSHCGPLWWDLGYDFDRQHHATAQCAIGKADWVMIPRMIAGQGSGQQTVAVMRELYASYLSQHYTQARETPDWILLRRAH